MWMMELATNAATAESRIGSQSDAVGTIETMSTSLGTALYTRRLPKRESRRSRRGGHTCVMPTASRGAYTGSTIRDLRGGTAMAVKFRLNGKRQTVDVPAAMPLLWVLRDTIGATGTKFGCGLP